MTGSLRSFGDSVFDLRTVLPGTPDRRPVRCMGRQPRLARRFLASTPPGARSLSDLQDDEGLRVLPPVDPMGTILAAGVNYREHVIQMAVAHKLGRKAPRRAAPASTPPPKSTSACHG